jgi:hypothetical protein
VFKAIAENPFLHFKARSLFVVGFFISLATDIALGLLCEFSGFSPKDPIFVPIVYTLTFVLLSVWARQHLCRLQINFKRLIGYLPNNYSWLPTVALIIAILLFSLGSGQLFYYILSFPAPTLVDSLLQQKTFLSNSDTLAPLLHNLLIVIVVTLVAPITEELIFRGILLHRWAIKWGVTPGLLLSTSLFAVFHANIIGLFVFGLMMALLYIRTRTLIVPIVCHALNNFIVIGLELVSTTSNTVEPTDLLEQLHSYWWVGVVYSLFQASEIRMV